MPVDELNFQRAEYRSTLAPLSHCTICGKGIAGEFYRANGDLCCPVCAEHIRSLLPKDTSGVFWRSMGSGVVAATGASLLYLLLFRLMTSHGMGMATAFGAIGVGYVIGKAMQSAGPTARGRRYQIAAAALTYAAVTAALMMAMLGALFGALGLPVWTCFLFPLGPVFLIFAGQLKLALFQLFFAAIGIQWAWMLLTSHLVKITGPESVALLDAAGDPGAPGDPDAPGSLDAPAAM